MADTKGLSDAEKAKAAAQERLSKSNYTLDGEHLSSADALEAKLNDEFKKRIGDMENFPELASWEYKFANGVSREARNALRFNSEGEVQLNQLTPAYVKPEWLKFVEQLTGFFALLLWAGSILCWIGYGLRKDVDNLYLAVVLMAVVTITGIFSYMQEAKSASLMDEFSKMRAEQIKVRTDWSFKPPKEGADEEWVRDDGDGFNPIYLVRGDIVTLKSGDKVPADIRVLEAQDFKVDNSPLTGEPDALERGPKNSIKDEKEAKNVVFYGTDAKNGTCTGVVLRIGDDTFIGKIAQLTEDTAVVQTPINKEIHRFIIIVSSVAIILGVTFFFVGLGLGTELITNLVFVIGIIVANVPEGLLATVTVCLTLTSKSMASKNVLVKNMEGVETLGSTTCICSDKTGTLTQNKMTFAELLFDQKIFRTEFVAPGEQPYPDIPMDNATFRLFHSAMCLNTTASFKLEDIIARDATGAPKRQALEDGSEANIPAKPFYTKATAEAVPTVNWGTKGDASESSIIKFAQWAFPGVWNSSLPTEDASINAIHNEDLMERHRREFPMAPQGQIPFNSANKYHVKVTENVGNTEYPYTVWMKGAPERIMVRCDHMIQGGERVEMDGDSRSNINQRQAELMAKGRRVLAFAKYDIPASLVPSHANVKRIKVAKRDAEGNVIRDRKGEPVLEDVEASIPFEMDETIRNVPLGDDAEEREEHIENFRAENADDMDAAVLESKIASQRNSCIKLTFIGMAALIDPPRPAVPDAVLSCQRAGIRVVMVTGDHPDTAAAIAKMVNIFTTDEYKKIDEIKDGVDPCVTRTHADGTTADVANSRSIVVPGWTITPDTTDEMWRFIFSHDEVVFARTSPAQKLQIVERFQIMEKDIVAVTGDGVNDAPALKKADIGVAMGIAGTPVSKSAADMVLMDDNFASIVTGVEEGRLIFDNLKKSIAYTLSSNIPEIAPFLIFITLQTPLPLSTVLILLIDLGTDMVPAISMAWERAEADIMRRPARDANVDRLVTTKLVFFAYLQIGIIQALAGFFTWFVVMNDYGFPPHIMPGNGAFDNWGKQVLFCKVNGGVFYSADLSSTEPLAGVSDGTTFASTIQTGHVFWDDNNGAGSIEECTFASKNFKGGESEPSGFNINTDTTYGTFTNGETVPTAQSYKALIDNGFLPYIPKRSVDSEFWNDEWLSWNINKEDFNVPGVGSDTDNALRFGVQPFGLWSINPDASTGDDTAQGSSTANDLLSTDKVYTSLGTVYPNDDGNREYGFFQPTLDNALDLNNEPATGGLGSWIIKNTGGTQYMNIASRMAQKEALHHAQTAYFVSIVVVQWADLMICKTRWLSIFKQGLVNGAMNFGLLFETILAAVFCYVPAFHGIGTRPLRLLHWVPAVPFSIVIFLYDEIRKYLMREQSKETKQGEQIVISYGWLGRNTYY